MCMRSRQGGSEGSTARGVPREGRVRAQWARRPRAGLAHWGVLGSSIARPFSSPAPTHAAVPHGRRAGQADTHIHIHHISHRSALDTAPT